MPCHAPLRNVVSIASDPKVILLGDIDRVQSAEDAGPPPERDALETDIFVLAFLRLVPRTDVHGVGSAAVNVFLVLGVGDPAGDTRVKLGVGPGIDVNGESLCVDLVDVGPDPRAGSFSTVELPEETHHLGGSDVGTLEVDAARGLELRFIPGMVLLSAEFARLDVDVAWFTDEVVQAGGVEGSVRPSVDVCLEFAGIDVVGVGSDANVGAFLDVHRGETAWNAGRGDVGLGELDDLGSSLLGVVPEVDLLGVERAGGRHVDGGGGWRTSVAWGCKSKVSLLVC